MTITLHVDVDTGKVSRTIGGAPLTSLPLYLGDIVPLSLGFVQNGAANTNTVLSAAPTAATLKVGLRTSQSADVLLAMTNTYTLASSLAAMTLSLNTQDVLDAFTALEDSTQSIQAILEVEVTTSGSTYRQTFCQLPVVLWRGVNEANDATPQAAADSAAQTALDAIATAADRVQTGLDAVATAADRVQTGLDRVSTTASAVATAADAVATAADAVATAADAIATAADAAQTALDVIATAADRVQTGLDRVQTTADAVATAADRVQTGLDRTAASTSATNAGTSETNAGNSATAAASSAGAAAAVGVSLVTTYLPGKAARPGIVSAGTSAVGTMAAGVSTFTTGDFTIGLWSKNLFTTGITNSRQFSLGSAFAARLNANSPFFTISGSNYSPAAGPSLADNVWAFLTWTFNRSTNSVTCYANGASYSTISITATGVASFGSTAAWTLGSLYDGTVPSVGTFGEFWVVNGLLTATQIADIYKNGGIAPSCAFATASATTGQSVATIGGLSFFVWWDAGQGYGPILRDRSGNNNHALMGTTGLTHAVPRNPPGLPARAPRSALVFDGTASARAFNTLGTGAVVATGNEFTLWWDGVVANQTDSASASCGMVTLSANATTVAQAKAFGIWINSSTGYGFNVILYGATTADTRQFRTGDALSKQLTGKRCVLAAVKTTSGLAVYLGYEGDFYNITNFSTGDATGGSPPAFTADVDGQNLVLGYRSSGSVFSHTVFGARLANVAMTEAQLRTEYERGEPGEEWRGATKTKLINSDFSAGVDGWTADSGSVSAPATVGAVSNALKEDSGATTLARVVKTVTLALGRRYRLTYDLYIPSTNVTGRTLVWKNNANSLLSFTSRQPAVDTWVTYTEDITSNLACTSIKAQMQTTGFSDTITAGDVFYLKNVQVEAIGYTARLRTDTAAGLTALNASKSSTNDSTDFLFSTTGVTTSPDGRTQTIRAQTTTSGNQQLFGASVIDTTKKWRIRSWNITSTGTPTVSLGSASAGAQYVSGAVLTAATNEITLLLRIPTVANLWCNSSSTATLDHVVVLDLVE